MNTIQMKNYSNTYSTNETISHLNIMNEINEPIKEYYNLLFKEVEETSKKYIQLTKTEMIRFLFKN